ncbi:MAG: PEGA domain-containing protein [bacterium]|nr:PEGA domain-containing protein [bacterium]
MTTMNHRPIILLGAGHGEALGLLEAAPPRGQRAVRIECEGLSLANLAAAALLRLGVSPEGLEPDLRLEAAIRELNGECLLLLVSGIPPETAMGLREWTERLRGDLRVVVGMGPPVEGVLARLAPVSAEIQVGVLGPQAAAMRVRRMLSGNLGEGRRSNVVTMAQLAKARRNEGLELQEGSEPQPPAGPDSRPMPAATPTGTASTSAPSAGGSQANAPSSAAEPASPARTRTKKQAGSSARDRRKKRPSRPSGWVWLGRGLAAMLVMSGAAWWALGPPEVYTELVRSRDPRRAPSVEEPLPAVSASPPQTAQPQESALEVPESAPEVEAAAIRPAPAADISPTPAAPIPPIPAAAIPPIPAAARPRLETAQDPAASPGGLPHAALEAPESGVSTSPFGSSIGYAPPITRDPNRIPEILRIGPPSPRRASIDSEGSEPASRSALTATVLPVAIDAEPSARVLVDGRLLGVTPIREAQIRPGLHTFTIEFENGQTSQRSVRVGTANQNLLFRLVPTGSP